MNISVVLAGVLLAGAVWTGLLFRLRAQPWQRVGYRASARRGTWPALAAGTAGLNVFMIAATCLFALLAGACYLRSLLPGWNPVPLPRLLWLNTALLVLASGALASACRTLAGGARAALRRDLLGGALLALAFLGGQWLACRQLYVEGFSPASSADASFFYLFTALHGAQLCGGLCVLARTSYRVARGGLAMPAPVAQALALNVRLCAVYWHYLLLLWLALFALLSLT